MFLKLNFEKIYFLTVKNFVNNFDLPELSGLGTSPTGS